MPLGGGRVNEYYPLRIRNEIGAASSACSLPPPFTAHFPRFSVRHTRRCLLIECSHRGAISSHQLSWGGVGYSSRSMARVQTALLNRHRQINVPLRLPRCSIGPGEGPLLLLRGASAIDAPEVGAGSTASSTTGYAPRYAPGLLVLPALLPEMLPLHPHHDHPDLDQRTPLQVVCQLGQLIPIPLLLSQPMPLLPGGGYPMVRDGPLCPVARPVLLNRSLSIRRTSGREIRPSNPSPASFEETLPDPVGYRRLPAPVIEYVATRIGARWSNHSPPP